MGFLPYSSEVKSITKQPLEISGYFTLDLCNFHTFGWAFRAYLLSFEPLLFSPCEAPANLTFRFPFRLSQVMSSPAQDPGHQEKHSSLRVVQTAALSVGAFQWLAGVHFAQERTTHKLRQIIAAL